MTRRKFYEIRSLINQAFDEWDTWSGGQGNWEEQDEYHAMVEKARAKVLAAIKEIPVEPAKPKYRAKDKAIAN